MSRRMRRVVAACAVVGTVLGATVAGACVATPPGAPNGSAPNGAAWAVEMRAAINGERAKFGLGPLAACGTLDLSAQGHSNDQAAHGFMGHTGSNGSNFTQRMAAAGYVGWTAGAENVAMGQGSVAEVMGAWMSSTGHRNNLLSGAYEHVGVGLAYRSNGTPYWTQVFGASGTC